MIVKNENLLRNNYNYHIVFLNFFFFPIYLVYRIIRARSDGVAEWSAIGCKSKKEENAKKDVGIW